jgi:hypothetical protein
MIGRTSAHPDHAAGIGAGITYGEGTAPMGSWHLHDLTAATGAPQASFRPAGYVFDAQGTQRVSESRVAVMGVLPAVPRCGKDAHPLGPSQGV